MNPDAHGWYRVHAVDGSGLDYSTTVFDPEIHDLVDEPASDAHGRPFPATAPVAVEEESVDEPVVGIPAPADIVPGKTKADKADKAEEANK